MSESDGTAFVVAVVRSGVLATDVVVNFRTEPITAIGARRNLLPCFT